MFHSHSSRLVHGILFLELVLLSSVGIMACNNATPPGASVEVKATNVDRAKGTSDFVPLPALANEPLNAGDRLRLSQEGEALLHLPCALALLFGGSNLQLQQVSLNGANLNPDGAQLFSSKCDNIRLDNGEALIQSTGTVFVAIHNRDKHMTLLWTPIGNATLAKIHTDGRIAETKFVSAGHWSVVRPDQEASEPDTVANMGSVLDEMNVRAIYERVVSILQNEGFGPSAPVPTVIALIETATPTPTATPTNTPTSTPTLTSTPCAIKPFIAAFSASPTEIVAGGSVKLSWETRDADSVTLDDEAVEPSDAVAKSPTTTTTYTLSARACGTIVTSQVTVTVLGNFAGAWFANFGTAQVSQSGAKVTGSFTAGLSKGALTGVVKENVLTGTWTLSLLRFSELRAPATLHPFRWTLSDDGNTFDGILSIATEIHTAPSKDSYRWCGARENIPFPDNCGFAGDWTVNLPGVGSGAMNLQQVGTHVSGKYFNGTLDGTVVFSSEGIVLSGTWHAGSEGPFNFRLTDINGNQFQGNWDNTNPWCGWREGFDQPDECLLPQPTPTLVPPG